MIPPIRYIFLDQPNVCTFQKYALCLNVSRNDETCESACLPKCERTLIAYRTENRRGNNLYATVGFNYASKYGTPEFSEFIEISTWSFNEFIGALGGALGLWLGIDFLLLI